MKDKIRFLVGILFILLGIFGIIFHNKIAVPWLTEVIITLFFTGFTLLVVDQGIAEFVKVVIGKREKRNRQEMLEARHRPLLFEFLEDYYPYRVLNWGGRKYPTAVIKFELPIEDADSILGDLDLVRKEDYLINDEKYLRNLEQVSEKEGKLLYNGRTYILDHIDKESMKIYCRTGSYYGTIKSCVSLEGELLSQIGCIDFASQFNRLRKKLVNRDLYQLKEKDPFYSGSQRSAAVGISTLLVFVKDSSYYAFLAPRSNRTAIDANLLNTIPSEMFSPEFSTRDGGYSIKLSIFREYLEEMFGLEEASHAKGHTNPSIIWEHEESQYLLEQIEKGTISHYVTGYAFNLLNLRLEVCSLLLIHEPKWHHRKFNLNYEFLDERERAELNTDLLYIDIKQSDEKIIKLLTDNNYEFVPSGAGAFWLGIDLAREKNENQ